MIRLSLSRCDRFAVSKGSYPRTQENFPPAHSASGMMPASHCTTCSPDCRNWEIASAGWFRSSELESRPAPPAIQTIVDKIRSTRWQMNHLPETHTAAKVLVVIPDCSKMQPVVA